MPSSISQRIITATLTPLDEQDALHLPGLEAHLNDQYDSGIRKLLIAGTMGLMPLLPDQTWADLVASASRLNGNRFELLVGATDHSTARMLKRIDYLNEIDGLDAVTVMTPCFYKFTADQYVSFYRNVASASRYPVLVYHLPGLTGVQLSIETWLKIAETPNIVGAKMSGYVSMMRKLAPLWPKGFRAIVAEPLMTDQLFRAGIPEHLDGLWALAPEWAVAIDCCCEQGRFDDAATAQDKLNRLHSLLVTYGVFETATLIMNARGIPGRMAPHPIDGLPAESKQALQEQLKELGMPKAVSA